ncbi:MAG: CDP-alcohol phosphatidyltransferase family protein [Flavobacterium sp.]|nr:CDP-alcohol phosphatidyltransferase family protein [Flavobacterium sp.]
MIKQIPNIFTLLNLFFGCLAIIATVQTGLIISTDNSLVIIPEKIVMASLFIAIAAVVDFFDGFVARLLKVPSALGKQLDSLADVVSFGVAPGMIVYQFLRLSFAQQANGLDVNTLWLMPAFILPCAGAYRLARFNIDTEQSYGFKGVPIPAAGLLVAAFPLIFWFENQSFLMEVLIDRWPKVGLLATSFRTITISVLVNKWFWYAVVFVTSYLMVSTLPMLAFKFKNATLKSFVPFIIIAVVAIVAALFLNWMAVPITFAAYVIVSLVFKPSTS